MDIFPCIRSLNFPVEKYIVIGGAALAARKIKKTRDVDILISQDLLDELRMDTNWHHHARIIPSEEPGLINKERTVEIYPTMNGVTFNDVKTREEIIDGIPFANLEDIITIKKTYNREKDQKDIILIQEYLKLNP